MCWYVLLFFFFKGERYDFLINAEQPVGAYWIQVRGLGECGRKRVQQLGILRYARGPYQPTARPPTYDVGLPQGVVNINLFFSRSFYSHHIRVCIAYVLVHGVLAMCTHSDCRRR